MIRWLLSLFSEYRSLTEDLQSAISEKLILQDRLDAVMNDRSELWRMMETAINNERATLQMQVNFQTQQRFGVTPFPDATHLPQESNAQGPIEPMPRRQMPSELIQNGTARFIRQFQERHVMKSGPVEEVKD